MYYIEVAPTRIVRSGSDSFTYSSSQALPIGAIVEIEIGKTLNVGIVISQTTKPTYTVKPITQVIEATSLPEAIVDLARWMSRYYASPLAQCLQMILPRGITKNRRVQLPSTTEHTANRTNFLLNEDQRNVLAKLKDASGTYLLHGVTGSGKTIIYIEQAKATIAAGKSVIILVPEIALTSQLVNSFSEHFPDIIVTHSHMSESVRHQLWQQALSSTTPRVIIGPRSALFMPLTRVGLVVVDECHEPSFQQEKSPRYSALRVASKYMELSGGLTLLGSATPLTSDYFLAAKHNKVLTLPRRARHDSQPPETTLVDMTKRTHFTRHSFLSDQLLAALTESFANKKQALIFHNRRGSATITLCENCGWQAGCPRCFIPLTLHTDTHSLQCHICGLKTSVPTSCPECSHADILHKGIGTKRIESELRRLFPKVSIARFDGDSDSINTVNARYDELHSGSIDLIIGTQVVAKGLDLPHLETVGVIQADAGLSLPDFSSPERTFQLLAQVVGRVGRSKHATKLIVQSYQPTHSAIQNGIAQNYTAFYEQLLKQRQHTHFPPYRFLLKLTCIYKTEAVTIRNTKSLLTLLETKKAPDIELLGPTPSFYERVGDTYRWHIIAKSPTRSHLTDLLTHLPPSHWQYELDPISLL